MRMKVGWGVGALCGILVGLGGCEPPPSAGSGAPQMKDLTILTPHNETIRETFREGFWNWHVAERGTPVRIHWIYRGTPQCVDYVRAGQRSMSEGARFRGADVMFGGGVTDHATLAAEGLSQRVDLEKATEGIPAEVNGLATRDPEGRWYATGLSSFGILVNEAACARRGVDPPTTWTDLATPEMFGWLAVADPSASGSHRECLVLTLQSQGWDAGWADIMRMLANARALNARSGEALQQVASGVSLATFAVNFDGMARAAESDGELKYIDPAQVTAVTPDVISVLSGASDAELARDFVRFVLSEPGQALWAVKRSPERPHGETLYHYAIRASVYEKYADELAVNTNPLAAQFGMVVDADAVRWQGEVLKLIVRAATAGDNHVALQRCWESAIAKGLPDEAVALLTASPMSEDEARMAWEELAAGDAAVQEAKVKAWTEQFRERYAQVQAKLGG
jgi:iron(III) transport system substrate-binding protein